MKAIEFAAQIEGVAQSHLGSEAERIVVGGLPNGDMLAVYQGHPPDGLPPSFQVFTAAAKSKEGIIPGDVVPIGSNKVVHPSRSIIYGKGEDGQGTRGPWRIEFGLGIVALPAQLSGENPRLIVPQYVRGISGILHVAGSNATLITPLPFY